MYNISLKFGLKFNKKKISLIVDFKTTEQSCSRNITSNKND